MTYAKLQFVLIAFFCMVISNHVSGQKHDLKFEHIGTDMGLSHSHVSCIFQDSRGFMWFGGRDGLNKYDGYTFTVYKNDPKDPNSISHNTITAIKEDVRGNLWVATWGGGLNMFDREKEMFLRFKHNPEVSSISDNQVHTLEIDTKGNLWIGYENNGLDYFNIKENKITHFLHDKDDPSSLANDYVKYIYEDKNRNIWVGTYGGMDQFNLQTGKFSHFPSDPTIKRSLSHHQVNVIFEDKSGRLWVGTDGGLNLFHPKTGDFTHFVHDVEDTKSIKGNRILSLIEDAEGTLWIGSENGGLSLMDRGSSTFQNFVNLPTDPFSLNSNSVWSIYADINQNVWLGTFNGGINVVKKDANKFKHYRHISGVNSLSSNKVLCIFEDSKENLWIGTDGGGINIYDRREKKITHLKHELNNKNSICGDYVLKVVEDSHGNIWIGTWKDGLTIINGETNAYTHYKHEPDNPLSLSSDNCWEIFEDSEKNIWVGTFYGGLNLFNPDEKTFTRFMNDPADSTTISSNRIFSLEEDSNGNLILGTDGGGLNIFNKKTKKFKSYRSGVNNKGLLGNSVFSTLEDQTGNLWIGTDIGLSYLDRTKNIFTNYTEENGLPNNMVFGILDDEKGNLWLSTNKGLSKFNLQSKTFKNFTSVDGLQGDEFKEEARCKSKSGALYFGGNNGFNEFYADSVMGAYFDPPIVFTDFQIFNKKVPIALSDDDPSPLKKHINVTDHITLSHTQAVFSFKFASLNYVRGERKHYSYKLDGFDENWNTVGTSHAATYTNLDPGNYTFKVRGVDSEGNWSPKTASIQITIEPPFWNTWWFKLLFLFSITGILFLFYQARVKVIKTQKAELEKQVKERTVELQQANTDIKDSIRASLQIQQSILPPIDLIKKHLPDIFIVYEPKDVVSGDFYWFHVKDEKIIIAAVDCAGHGVSGAFMSINGHHLLNQATFAYTNLVASEILDRLHENLLKEMHHDISSGMDIGISILDLKNKTMQYAGANNQLYILRNNEIIEIKGDRLSIGQQTKNKVKRYRNCEIDIRQDDMLYMFSDGYADQIGGETGEEKFMYNRFRKIIKDIGAKTLDEQKKLLEEAHLKWRGKNEQLDDLMIIGIRI